MAHIDTRNTISIADQNIAGKVKQYVIWWTQAHSHGL